MGPFVARGREVIGAWEKLPMPVTAETPPDTWLLSPDAWHLTTDACHLAPLVCIISPEPCNGMTCPLTR